MIAIDTNLLAYAPRGDFQIITRLAPSPIFKDLTLSPYSNYIHDILRWITK
jgi:hypothetical protein